LAGVFQSGKEYRLAIDSEPIFDEIAERLKADFCIVLEIGNNLRGKKPLIFVLKGLR
jgi:hypothetical protein